MKNTPILFVALWLLATSCAQAQSGPIVKRTLDLPAIEAIGLGLKGTVYLKQGSPQEVVIEAQESLLDEIDTRVTDGNWNIEFKNRKLSDYKPIAVFITLADIRSIAIGGSGKVIAEEAFQLDQPLEISIGGSGLVQMKGTAPKTEISIAGSGKVEAEDFEVEKCEVSIAGSGKTYIHVNSQLEVSVAGSGKVFYKGDPKKETSIAGSGKVEKM
jgi:hypothetical protein